MTRPTVPVIGRKRDGTEISFDSISDAAKQGFKASCISRCIKGLEQTHHGYAWRRGRIRSKVAIELELKSLRYRHALLLMWLNGATYEAIGKRQGFSKQRAHQLIGEAIRISGVPDLWRHRRHLIAAVNTSLLAAEAALEAEYESHP
jgi:hypothetical protein